MPLNPEHRENLEDVIMDLHFTSSKFIESEKDVHKKMLEVSVNEALELLQEIRVDIIDDDKVHDYKLHMLIPFQLFRLIKLREEKQHD